MKRLASDWFIAWIPPSDWSKLTSWKRAKKVAKEFLNETGSEQRGPVKIRHKKHKDKTSP